MYCYIYKTGISLGKKFFFSYKISFHVQVNQKTIDLSSEVGKKLGQALILPEKVQEFAICREILMTQNKKVMFESAYPFLSIFSIYNITSYLNQRLNLYVAPVAIRAMLYSITGLFGFGIYFLLKDITEVHYETSTDKALVELGPDYIKNGVIFYEKLLGRNQALRELMGSEGERKYTVKGNVNYGIRQPHVALVHRKQFFESKLKQNTDINLEEGAKSTE